MAEMISRRMSRRLACHAVGWVNGAKGMSDMAGKAAR